MFNRFKIVLEEIDKYSKIIGDIYSLHNPYVSTGVMKSKVVDFINNLKDEGIIDNFEQLDNNNGFSIHIYSIRKHKAFFDYFTGSNLIKGTDWDKKGNVFILFYAFE